MSKASKHTHKQTARQHAHPKGWVQAATPEVRAWILQQHEAGCIPRDILASLTQAGWEAPLAQRAMEEVIGYPMHNLLAQVQRAEDVRPAERLPEPALAGGVLSVWAHDRQVQVLAQMASPRVVVFGGLLAPEECDELIALARSRLTRSETVVNETGGSEVNAARTSEGMFFQRGEYPLCERIEARLAALLNWPVNHGEGLQLLRYGVGAEYRPHHDYFDPSQPGTPSILARGGQRLASVVMYLNTPDAGGATTFPDVGFEVAAQRGNAVFFSYDRPDPATKTLHGGAPVQAGEKWVATKWLREGVFA